jgi:hypothetical protein
MSKIQANINQAINTHSSKKFGTTNVNSTQNLTVVSFYSEPIAIIDWNTRSILIDHHGTKSNTTKSRLNAIVKNFLPLSKIKQEGGKWWVLNTPIGNQELTDEGLTLFF